MRSPLFNALVIVTLLAMFWLAMASLGYRMAFFSALALSVAFTLVLNLALPPQPQVP
jgi:hypothetical protein